MAHPPWQPGWIDQPHQTLSLGDWSLENGDTLRDLSLSYVVHGDLKRPAAKVVLALSAIASTHHRLDFLIGPGRALDPDELTIIAVDAIGNGLSSSPSNSLRQPGLAFPRFGIRDMVATQAALLDHLGVARLHAVIGASMGGMQALQWAVSYPTRLNKVIAMTPMARTSAWSVAINETSRRAILADPQALQGGDAGWAAWVPLMHLISGRTPDQLDQQFRAPGEVTDWIAERIAWWAQQRFAAVDWLYQSWAYDAHDVGNTPGFDGDTNRALATIVSPVLILAPPLDLYNPSACARQAALQIPNARFVEIDSVWGHQAAGPADDQAAEFLNRTIGRFLAL